MKNWTVFPIVVLTLSTAFGQEPGKPAQPAKVDTAPQQAADDARAFVAIDLTPSEADKALDDFKKRVGWGADGLVKTREGRTYLFAAGEATVTSDRKPGWVQKRILALGEAELKARAEMAKTISATITSGQYFEQFDGPAADLIGRLKGLKAEAEKGGKAADLYKEATAVTASQQVVGAVTAKTIEGEGNGGEYKIIRVLMWSPVLFDLAVNTLADSKNYLPAEDVAGAAEQQIPAAEAELVKEVGAKVYLDRDGRRYYVAFGQAEPLAESKAAAARAVTVAKERAELHAYGQLARTLAASVSLVKEDQQSVLKTFGPNEPAEKLALAFFQRMESESKDLKISGTVTVRTWQYQHPDWKLPVVGAVVVWTPARQDAVKSLGLGRTIDPTATGQLVDLLAKKYGLPAPAQPGRGGKPGVTESKDPVIK